MTAQLQCDCGKYLRIPEHHAGRRVQCPSCGKTHMMTAENIAESPMNVGVTAWPALTTMSAPPSIRRTWPHLAGMLLLALAVGAGTWWWLNVGSTAASEGDDLALIPANAQGIVSIRLADLWKTPAMQKALLKEEDPPGQMEEETGLRPENVERLSVVTVDLDNHLTWNLVRTVAPYDAEKVLSRLGNRREGNYHGERYHLGTGVDEKTWAIYLAGTRVLVAGTETGVKHCLDLMREERAGRQSGPLEPIVTQIADGTHTVVVGVYPGGGPVKMLKTYGLDQMQRGQVFVDVSDKVELVAMGQCASEDTAKKLQTAIKKQLVVAQAGLGLVGLFGGEKGKMAGSLATLLNEIKFEQKGSEVTATARIDDGSSVAATLLALPRFLTQ
jgi:hypothetical protein